MPPFKDRGGVGLLPGGFPDTVQSRASRNRLISVLSPRSPHGGGNTPQTAGDEPLILELEGPTSGTHWVLSYLAAYGQFKVRNLVANVASPVAGLFVVDAGGSAAFDSQADATGAGWNFFSRAASLPIFSRWQTMALTAAGAGFAFECQAQIQQPLIIPSGFTIRFIAICAPGTATPGPGVGSFGQLVGWGTSESDVSV